MGQGLVSWLRGIELPHGIALNVNIPAQRPDTIRGVRITRQGTSRFVEQFDRRVDPRGNVYYWQEGETMLALEAEDVDSRALRDGYISITPIHYDLTAHHFLNVIPKPDLAW